MSRRDRPSRLRVGTRRELGLWVGIGFLVTVMIGLGAAFASRSVAQNQALEDSERITVRMANQTVKPLWMGYRSGNPAEVEKLQRAVATRKADGNLTEVTVWSADAVVLYSDKRGDIGKRLPPPDDLVEALAGETTSGFETGEPEADAPPAAPTGQGADSGATGPNRFVEVYTPLQVDGEPPMVFEAYFDYNRVDRLAHRLLRQTLPLVLVPLLVLQLVQIPIAISLARRIRRHEHERARLLEQSLSASDRERARFAADLHDGPIQDLAAVSFMLGAVATTVVDRHALPLARTQDRLQRSMGSLRGLMTDLYPPDLGRGTLDQTLTTLADRLRDGGLDVVLDLRKVPPLSEEGALTFYWVAREALANVQKHARASTVRIGLSLVEGHRGRDEALLRLVITDDGVGFNPGKLNRRPEDRLGLGLLANHVESLGGELVVTSVLGRGTTVQAELEARRAVADPARQGRGPRPGAALVDHLRSRATRLSRRNRSGNALAESGEDGPGLPVVVPVENRPAEADQ
jgi:two-component system, NarL family, sensor kinase